MRACYSTCCCIRCSCCACGARCASAGSGRGGRCRCSWRARSASRCWRRRRWCWRDAHQQLVRLHRHSMQKEWSGWSEFFAGPEVPTWIASATTFLVTYGFGLALVIGFAFYQRLRDSQLRSAALERALTAAHLAALRMQLSPHTLFNLLHTIRGQIAWDPPAAQSDGRAARRPAAAAADRRRAGILAPQGRAAVRAACTWSCSRGASPTGSPSRAAARGPARSPGCRA